MGEPRRDGSHGSFSSLLLKDWIETPFSNLPEDSPILRNHSQFPNTLWKGLYLLPIWVPLLLLSDLN